LNFLQFSIEFTSQQHNSHEITKTLTQRSPNSTVPMSLELVENPLNLFQLLHEVVHLHLEQRRRLGRGSVPREEAKKGNFGTGGVKLGDARAALTGRAGATLGKVRRALLVW
jgi:hypothetical protein